MFYYGTLITEVTELKLRSNTTSIWFGDSGGPVVKRGWNGSLVVVGVLASFTVFQGDLMDFSATDVRQYFEELNSVIKGWENQPQDSVLGVCSGNSQP